MRIFKNFCLLLSIKVYNEISFHTERELFRCTRTVEKYDMMNSCSYYGHIALISPRLLKLVTTNRNSPRHCFAFKR